MRHPLHRAVTKDVGLIPAKFRVEVLFISKTTDGSAATHVVIVKFEGGSTLGAATAVERNASTHVHVKGEIACERFQEGFIQHWGRSLAWFFCAIRVGKDTGVEDRTTISIRFECFHLGFHGLDALLVLPLHLVHLRLQRRHITTLTGVLSKKPVSSQ